MSVLIIICLVSFTTSFFCSMSEACLLSLSITDIAKISERKPAIATIWRSFRENIQKPIAVILIINTFANAVGAALCGAEVNRLYGSKWVTLFSIVFSLIIIQWCEILPKTIGFRFNRTIAQLIAFPLKFLVTILSPLLAISQFINQPFHRKKAKATTEALNDITVLTRFAAVNNLISKDQASLVSRSIDLSRITVADVMMPKHQIKYLSSTMTLSDALVAAHMHHHTRYPLTNGNNENDILGYINFKDIVIALRINPKDPTLRGIVRPILTVHDTDIISTILSYLTQGHYHIALVKNKANEMVGLVTMEDVIEEITGEIQDEFDILPNYFRSLPDNRFVIGGATPLAVLRKKVCPGFPEEPTTIDIWLRSQIGKEVQRDDRITLLGIDFVITKLRRSRIFEVQATCREPAVAS